MKRIFFFSVLCLSFVALSAVIFVRFWDAHTVKVRGKDRYLLRKIAQTGPRRGALPTDYLAQMLDLSNDRVPSLLTFDFAGAREKLLMHPLIDRAQVSKWAPDTLYVDYSVSKPYAWLSDVSDVALDRKGNLLPVSSFFAPKRLPEIYLGLSDIPSWQDALKGEKIELAYRILDHLEREGMVPFRVDVSNAFVPILGKRELVVILNDPSHHYLRLTAEHFEEEWERYMKLQKRRLETSAIIDLRLSDLAFIKLSTR